MRGHATVEEIVPLVEAAFAARRGLLRLITTTPKIDSSVYEAIPPDSEEFSAGDEDPLAWDSEGWENVP